MKTEKSQNSQNHNFLDENQKKLMKGEYKDERLDECEIVFQTFQEKKKKKKKL